MNDARDPRDGDVAGGGEVGDRHERGGVTWPERFLRPLAAISVVIILLGGLGLAQRLGWLSTVTSGPGADTGDNGASKYICPMMCTPPLDEPGRCSVCGMELVSASAVGGDTDGRSIVVDAAARRIAGIETAEVDSVPLVRPLRAVGKLEYSQSGMKTLAAYVDGRIERLFADYTGVQVRRGDRLAVLYSPELYSAQTEYLSAREREASREREGRERGAFPRGPADGLRRSLSETARERLLELGMVPRQIDELDASGEARMRLDLFAEITGTVIEKRATEGAYVTTGQTIYRLADLTSVWLVLGLFPEDAAHIRYGQRVEARVQSLPGETFLGRVAFIDPAVDAQTRTVGVRVVIPNPAGRLRVGDFATATVEIPLDRDGQPAREIYDEDLAGKWVSPRHPHVTADDPGPCPVCGIEMVPADALGFRPQPVDRGTTLGVPRRSVLRAGQTSIVYVETEPGRFEPRRVTLGPNVGDSVIVLRGLKPGDRVAIAGNFLIDSQMQLAGNPSLIDPDRIESADRSGRHRHAGVPPISDPEHLRELESLDPEDRQRALAQRICPVTEKPLGSMGVPPQVEVDGRRVFICCEGCRKRLLEDPEKYLPALPDTAESEPGDEGEGR